ncbi:ester cyclase [Caulobacter sp. Root656]|nr:ester cyclase [Caulobacter sp. Root656]
MSSDAAHAFIRRFTNFINSGDPNLAPELVSTDAIFHAPGAAPLSGPDGYLQLLAMLRSAFSDVRWVLEEAVAEGDTIAARFSMSGTNDGSFMGAPPTGKAFQATSMGFYKLSGGKIVEERGLPDMLSILQQIGLVPQPS